MAAWFDTSHLQYSTPGTIVAPGTPILIKDWDVQNPTAANQIRYFLNAIDKMHDFESVYKAAMPNIRTTHFNLVQDADITAEKLINATPNASTKLTASAGTLQQIIDFKSYIKSVAMEGAAPQLAIRTPTFNYTCNAPFTMHTMSVGSSDAEYNAYKTLLPPTRDCFISLRGTAAEFDASANANNIRTLLNIAAAGAYVSKDAFPLGSDTVSKIFRAPPNNDHTAAFESYLSQLLDPATETKTIIRDGVRSVTIQSLYCVLSGGRRLFIKINIPSGTARTAEITFGISSVAATAVNGIVWAPTLIPINAQTPIPSIQDCVVWMLGNNAKPLKKTGAKIWNALKTGNLKQNTQAKTMNDYFNKILTNIAGIPGIGLLSNEDKDLIAIASKTNGDQSYKWDQLIADALGYQQSLHGTYKVTVDYYEFLDDVHSKQVNSAFASKSGRSLTGRSIYTMTIYLKPLSETAAAEFTAAAKATLDALNAKVAGLMTKNAVDKFVDLRETFAAKLKDLLAAFQTIFNNYVPENEKSRNTFYKYGAESNTQYASIHIANQYYSACQIVLDILGKIWSLDKAIAQIAQIDAVVDLNNKLQLLISAKNAYDDAAAYSSGFAQTADIFSILNTPLIEWNKQGSGIDSVVNSFNHQIGVLSKNMFLIPNVVPVKGLYGLSKPTIIGWFKHIEKVESDVMPGGGGKKPSTPSKQSKQSDGSNRFVVAKDSRGTPRVEVKQMNDEEMEKYRRKQEREFREQSRIAFEKVEYDIKVADFEEKLLAAIKDIQYGNISDMSQDTLDGYIAYMGKINLTTNVNDLYNCYELFSYIKYILDTYHPESDILYECVSYIILKLAPDLFIIYQDNPYDSKIPAHGGRKKSSRHKAIRTIKKRTNKMHKRTKRNRTQK